MEPLEVVRRRIAVQRLAGEPFASPAAAVRTLVAVQGQEWAEAKWSLALRCPPGTTDAAIEAAFAAGELVRTHVLRPTWHLVAPEDLRWLLALSADRVHARNAPYYRRHDLDDALLARGGDVLAAALAGGEPRSRAELRAALAAGGIEAEGTRLALLLMHAELEGIVCSGPRRGAQHTYVLVAYRAPAAPPFDRDAAVAELVVRFLAGHGPATARDVAWWSGLTVGDARAGVAAAGDRLERRGELVAAPGGFDGEPPAGGTLLVPTYDEVTVAFRDLRVVGAGPGDLERLVLIDGRVAGRWRRRGATLAVTASAGLDRAERRSLAAAAERYAAFLERPVELRIGP